jgi:aspartyl-tRNA synthetase
LKRTHHCSELRAEHIGQSVTLAGWVDARRDLGGVIFIELRDREGRTQVVFNPEANKDLAEKAHSLRAEFVLRVTGTVGQRPAGTENTRLATGQIEVVAASMEVLNAAETPPFPLDDDGVNEDLRLTHRYLDLRRSLMQSNLRTRHRLTQVVRTTLDGHGFTEIETPILSKSTPEGAREFLVPSRVHPGNFFALAQSPQQYKQLLMVAGMERYFQIAKCFRDEDPRADRVTELTQVDLEMSFITQEDIFGLIEELLANVFKATRGVDVPRPFQRLTWLEAMNQYGSDKPDRRFGMKLTDLSSVFKDSQFKVFKGALDAGGVVKAINAKKFACITTGQIEEMTELAKQYGAKGLAFIKVENGEWKSPIVKFFSEAEKAALVKELAIEEGDLILFGADAWETVCNVLGRIRLRVAEIQKLTEGSEALDFHWVIEFPLLEYSAEDDKWNARHHPFTRPMAEDIPLLEKGDKESLGKVRAEAYDVVLNGVEIGGGSIRIHERALQEKQFQTLGISEEMQQKLFPHLLKAFAYGAPPHGGIALGVDRLCMLICRTENIRDVIAFPKNNKGIDLMMSAPSPATGKQLKELHLQTRG